MIMSCMTPIQLTNSCMTMFLEVPYLQTWKCGENYAPAVIRYIFIEFCRILK